MAVYVVARGIDETSNVVQFLRPAEPGRRGYNSNHGFPSNLALILGLVSK